MHEISLRSDPINYVTGVSEVVEGKIVLFCLDRERGEELGMWVISEHERESEEREKE